MQLLRPVQPGTCYRCGKAGHWSSECTRSPPAQALRRMVPSPSPQSATAPEASPSPSAQPPIAPEASLSPSPQPSAAPEPSPVVSDTATTTTLGSMPRHRDWGALSECPLGLIAAQLPLRDRMNLLLCCKTWREKLESYQHLFSHGLLLKAIEVGVTDAIDSSSRPEEFKAKCCQALRTFLDDIRQGKLQDVLPGPAAAAVRNLTHDMIHAVSSTISTPQQDLTTDDTAPALTLPALVSIPHVLTDEGSEDPIPSSANFYTWVPANSKPVTNHKPSAPLPTGCTAVSTEMNSHNRPHFSVATCNAIGKALGLTTTQHSTLTSIDIWPVNTQDATFFETTRPSDSQQTRQVHQCRQRLFDIGAHFTKSAGAINLHGADSPRRLFGPAAVKNIGKCCVVPDCESYAVIHLQLDDAINAQLAAAGVNDVRSTLQQRGWGGFYFVIDTTSLNPNMAVFAAAPHISAATCAYMTLQNAKQPVLADSLVPFYFQALLRSKHNVLLQHHTAATPQLDLPACSALGLRAVATYAAQARLDAGLPSFLASGWTLAQAAADPEGAWEAVRAMNARNGVATQVARWDASVPHTLPAGRTLTQAADNPEQACEAARAMHAAVQQARRDAGIPSVLAAGWTHSKAAADPAAARKAARARDAAAVQMAGAAVQKARQDASLPPILPAGWTMAAAQANPKGVWAASHKAHVENARASAAARGKNVWSAADTATLEACMTPDGDWKEGYGPGLIMPDLPKFTKEQILNKRRKIRQAINKNKNKVAADKNKNKAAAAAAAAGAVGARTKKRQKC